MDTQKNGDFLDSGEQSFNFGTLLRQMIERMGVRQSLVADWLNCDQHTLNRVINGRQILTQRYVKKRNWRLVFADRCPDIWAEYAELFEQECNKLPEKKIFLKDYHLTTLQPFANNGAKRSANSLIMCLKVVKMNLRTLFQRYKTKASNLKRFGQKFYVETVKFAFPLIRLRS